MGGSFDATQALEGTLDELAIFGTALSASDVLAHYHARDAADERPPTLKGGSPLPEDGGSLTALLERFTIEASRDLVAAGVNDANSWELRGAGSDGAFATGDDVHPWTCKSRRRTRQEQPSRLSISDGHCRSVRIDSRQQFRLVDPAGHLLDGDGDAVGEGE